MTPAERLDLIYAYVTEQLAAARQAMATAAPGTVQHVWGSAVVEVMEELLGLIERPVSALVPVGQGTSPLLRPLSGSRRTERSMVRIPADRDT